MGRDENWSPSYADCEEKAVICPQWKHNGQLSGCKSKSASLTWQRSVEMRAFVSSTVFPLCTFSIFRGISHGNQFFTHLLKSLDSLRSIFTTYKRFTFYIQKPSLIFKCNTTTNETFSVLFFSPFLLQVSCQFHPHMLRSNTTYLLRAAFHSPCCRCVVPVLLMLSIYSARIVKRIPKHRAARRRACENKLHYLCFNVSVKRWAKRTHTSASACGRELKRIESCIRSIVDAISE